MSNSNTIYQNQPKSKVIARLYVNERFGKGIGNKRINRFIFNGALEFPNQGTKLWVDLPELQYAKSSCAITSEPLYSQIAHTYIRNTLKADPYKSERFLLGQLFDLNPKEWVDGFVLFDADVGNALVMILGENSNTPLVQEEFSITPVFKQTDGKAPDYFGVNFDLEENPKPKSHTSKSTGLGVSINTSALLDKVRSQMNA